MICPWLKSTRKYKIDCGETITRQSFEECRYRSCPFYVPEQRNGSFVILERCVRINTENNPSKAVDYGNDKG